MHDAETGWARFRNGPGGDLLREALALRGTYLESIGRRDLPPHVGLPGAAPGVEPPGALGSAGPREETGDTLSSEVNVLAATVACWAAYREAKTIYRVEPALAECLTRTPWPGHVPTEALRLPSRCRVLSLPRAGETVHVKPHYDLLTGGERVGLGLPARRLEGKH